ncbi:Uncharacterized protein PECH_000079 [Penicillium ucsense]|uniref:CRIB domain-containing protein n=1 Tax=Penicillium ucsense TaxID=2839758 RepID=A0A8J8W6V7_9EURO|nr:Uncharacterized protein PECM_003724 [Penicillium ucsense]KAF7739564.1 Uncharacterized protein PECH_000079 [Penicillium ucsense]
MSAFTRIPAQWDDDQSSQSDPPSTRSSNDPPEHASHFRSRSTAVVPSSKRLSVFGGRSRSNTTTSTASRRSPSSSMMSSVEHADAHDERAPSALGMRPDRSERSSRSLLSRGSRILRRQGSKITIAATLDEEDEPRTERPSRHRGRQADHHERLKSIISDPFDFHHLTHTSPSQFQLLDQARENDLVTEFSVIRASQRPEAGLKGIRAQDLSFRNFSTDDLAALGTATTANEPAPQSPPASPTASVSMSPNRGGRLQRESRTFENFSRPVPRYPRQCPTTPPPPMVPEVPAEENIEPAPRAIDEILGLGMAPTYPEYITEHSPCHIQFGPVFHDTFDNTRKPFSSNQQELEEVPEEDEGTRMWESPESSTHTAHSRSTSHVSPGTVEPHRMGRLAAPAAPLSIYVAEDLSRKFSEALSSPTLPQTVPMHSPNEEIAAADADSPSPVVPLGPDFSYADDLSYDSWDADIDYCYEHAAESTSDFDWTRTSIEESRPQINVAGASAPWGFPAPRKLSRHLEPSPLSTSTLATPDLDRASTRSSQPPPSASTPSTDYDRGYIHEPAGYFHPVAPSILSKQLNHDAMYEDYLSGADPDADSSSDRHFPFPLAGLHNASPRSSFSPISKCNSQESLMLSRAASVVRKHRSSVSTTSVPELVHSLSNSRELMPTDRVGAAETLARPASGNLHRSTKSLAETHLLTHADSNASLASAESALAAQHDRSKSVPDAVTEAETVSLSGGSGSGICVSTTPALPNLPNRNPNRKKSRTTSYSLFPTAAS